MSGNDTFAEHYVNIAYGRNLGLDAAQRESRIAVNVEADFSTAETGKSFSTERLGTSKPQEMGDRFGELPKGFVDKRRRVGHFKPYEDGKVVDSSYDKARTLVMDPASKTIRVMREGLARQQDEFVMSAMLGTAYAGENGTTAVGFPAGQTIAVNDHTYNSGGSGNVPLTVSKLQVAMEMMDAAEIAGERYIALPSKQINHLLTDAKVTSSDYNTVKALVAGEIDTFLRFKFIRYEPVLKSGSNFRCVAWVKPAVEFHQRVLEAPSMWKRRDKRPHWYAYYQMEMAAVRVEEKGVVDILCTA